MQFHNHKSLRDDVAEHNLVYACEDCCHFVAEQNVCDLLYPIELHQRAAWAGAAEGAPVWFCKMFEAR